jgi:transcriptional regulator GlxA family with amidase domain
MKTIGTVLFEGFEILDVYGPLELFGMLDPQPILLMMAEHTGPVKSYQGPNTVADFNIHEIKGLDILLIPGGLGTRRAVENQSLLNNITRLAHNSSYVATVCTGSGLLARTGLLDGRRATSNKRAFAWAKSQGPKVNWIAEARWVEDGKFFTSAGVSAGMDMALGLIERMFDRATSEGIASRAEYEWHSDQHWDPFAKLNGLV